MRSDLIIPILTAMCPILAVLVGILINRSESMRLDGRMILLETRLDAEISGLDNGLDSRIGLLVNRFYSDMFQVIGKLTELEVRVARLGEKQTR